LSILRKLRFMAMSSLVFSLKLAPESRLETWIVPVAVNASYGRLRLARVPGLASKSCSCTSEGKVGLKHSILLLRGHSSLSLPVSFAVELIAAVPL
jgi:hypothetical protein